MGHVSQVPAPAACGRASPAYLSRAATSLFRAVTIVGLSINPGHGCDLRDAYPVAGGGARSGTHCSPRAAPIWTKEHLDELEPFMRWTGLIETSFPA